MIARAVMTLILPLAFALAQGPPTSGVGAFPARPPGDSQAISRGKTLYGTNCAYCNGEDARGGENGGTNLLRADPVMKDKFGEAIGTFLRAETAAEHKFTLSVEQTADIAAYIHSFPLNSRDPGRMRPKTILVGDAKAGEAYFRTKCSGCHSATGDLRGSGGASDSRRSLQHRWVLPLIYTGRAIQAGHAGKRATVTVTLTGGEKVEGVLGRLDDFFVSLTTADGRERSFQRDGEVPKGEVHDPMQGHKDLL